jgi:S-adenosylmethionine hydrolase
LATCSSASSTRASAASAARRRHADGRWLVGPDNGLFEPLARRARTLGTFAIAWRPRHLSASFHGRDLFAPVAARLARGARDRLDPEPLTPHPDWPDDLPEVVYVDGYGNAVTGLRASTTPPTATLRAGGTASAGRGPSRRAAG